MVDEIKLTEEKTHTIIHERIDSLQLEIKNLLKFRWQISGVLILALSVFTVGSHLIPQFLTSEPQRVIINKQ